MTETIRLLPATSSGLRAAPGELQAAPVCSVLPDGTSLLCCDLLLAADGSDRLEVHFTAPAAADGPWGALRSCETGGEVALEQGSGTLFRGRLYSRGLRRDRGTAVASITACSDHREVAAALPPRTYYQHSDSELAETIAADLGLCSRVEATGDVLERIECPGHRLEFLRDRARAIGFEFAVTSGILFFASKLPACREVPGLPTSRGMLGGDAGVLDFSMEARADRGRGGSFKVSGDPGWRPLQELEILGMGDSLDGCYRVVQARHCWDHLGYRTRVDYLEDSVDLDSWRGGQGW